MKVCLKKSVCPDCGKEETCGGTTIPGIVKHVHKTKQRCYFCAKKAAAARQKEQVSAT